MYVEDLLLRIQKELSSQWCRETLTPWHHDFIQSISEYVSSDKPLSTKQSETFLKVVDKHRNKFIERGLISAPELAVMLNSPEHKQPLYESRSVLREVRHVGGNILAFRFKANKSLVTDLKALAMTDGTSVISFRKIEPCKTAKFDWYYLIWLLPVYRFNIHRIMRFIHHERFGMDEATISYLRDAKEGVDKPASFHVDTEHEVIRGKVFDDPLLASWITVNAQGVSL